MIQLNSLQELSEWISENRDLPRVLVPTMGALHRGHTSLFDLAREQSLHGRVMVSIFVNPTQFGPTEDLEEYPRSLQEDLEECRLHGVDVAFTPQVSEIYASDASISVQESQLSKRLCGASRPGHFDGVCTIVAKLFLMAQPDVAVFGEKDFQQLAVIRRMVRDLNFSTRIVSGPTIREEDGLAMSSRNALLSPKDRQDAPIIYESLSKVAQEIASRVHATPNTAIRRIRDLIENAVSGEIDYVEIVDPMTLEPLQSFDQADARLLAAVQFESTRLIDNVGVAGFNTSASR